MHAYLARRLVEFLKREDGPTAVEYAVMLALIIVVCVGAVGTLGQSINSKFENDIIKNALNSSS